MYVDELANYLGVPFEEMEKKCNIFKIDVKYSLTEKEIARLSYNKTDDKIIEVEVYPSKINFDFPKI